MRCLRICQVLPDVKAQLWRFTVQGWRLIRIGGLALSVAKCMCSPVGGWQHGALPPRALRSCSSHSREWRPQRWGICTRYRLHMHCDSMMHCGPFDAALQQQPRVQDVSLRVRVRSRVYETFSWCAGKRIFVSGVWWRRTHAKSIPVAACQWARTIAAVGRDHRRRSVAHSSHAHGTGRGKSQGAFEESGHSINIQLG